jgi:hypothetical protein
MMMRISIDSTANYIRLWAVAESTGQYIFHAITYCPETPRGFGLAAAISFTVWLLSTGFCVLRTSRLDRCGSSVSLSLEESRL